MTRRTRSDAAAYLTQMSGLRFTREGLAALATKGAGPPFCILNGRALYETDDLDEWLTARLADTSPSAKRGARPVQRVAA